MKSGKWGQNNRSQRKPSIKLETSAISCYYCISFPAHAKKVYRVFLGIAAFLAIILFTNMEPGKPEVTATMAVAALMAIWWVTETIPLAVTVLLLARAKKNTLEWT